MLRSYTKSPQSRSGESRCFAFNVGPLYLRKASFALTVELLPITPAVHQPFTLPRWFPPLRLIHNLGSRWRPRAFIPAFPQGSPCITLCSRPSMLRSK
jgi:hypothetical protein